MREFQDDKNIKEMKFLLKLFLTIIGIAGLILAFTIYEILTK
jgi:hypothetical protein